MSPQIDYTKICFVIMPFAKKMVENVEIDFDAIYYDIFEPAIAAVALPEGGKLIPKRTDQDYFATNIDTEMYQYLEYSRFALVDITGLNANVFYELGIRHNANQSGTAIFRQGDKAIPFDISHIKAFPYEYQPLEKVSESRSLITKVLTESLLYNRIDSPVQVALLAAQRITAPQTDKLLMDATNALRNGDLNAAVEKYRQALQQDSTNPVRYLEYGLLLKKQEKWPDAVQAFTRATELSPGYGEAWREMGIAQNKVYNKAADKNNIPSGEDAIKEAIDLNPDDFDAYASLGGIYKRQNRLNEAEERYQKALEVSNGHPYPLLNALILQIHKAGIASVSARQKLYLRRAEVPLRKQVKDVPPYNSPWSFFDLATICLLLGKGEESVAMLDEGLVNAKDGEVKTHLDTLLLIESYAHELPGLEKTLTTLKEIAGL